MVRLTLLPIILLLIPNSMFHLLAQSNSGNEENPFYSPFTGIGQNTIDSFTGPNLILQVGAIATTYSLVQTDMDYRAFRYFASHPEYDKYSTPAVYAGYLVPVFLGGGMWLYGLADEDSRALAAGSAVLQATLISTVYIGLLKAITGRPNPDPTVFNDMRRGSRTFRFGLLQGGVHYGWPSGHMGTNTAAMVSLMYFYPENVAVKLLGGAYLAYLAFGVASHDGSTMHWLSDIVAGTLIGFAVGAAVGSNFRKAWENDVGGTEGKGWSLQPSLSPHYGGVSVRITF
jgi:membrane-associated phospholipid phosphatase